MQRERYKVQSSGVGLLAAVHCGHVVALCLAAAGDCHQVGAFTLCCLYMCRLQSMIHAMNAFLAMQARSGYLVMNVRDDLIIFCSNSAALMVCRVVSCVLLKLFLVWVIGNDTSGPEAFPIWKGWVFAAALGITGYLMCLVHHQLFW